MLICRSMEQVPPWPCHYCPCWLFRPRDTAVSQKESSSQHVLGLNPMESHHRRYVSEPYSFNRHPFLSKRGVPHGLLQLVSAGFDQYAVCIGVQLERRLLDLLKFRLWNYALLHYADTPVSFYNLCSTVSAVQHDINCITSGPGNTGSFRKNSAYFYYFLKNRKRQEHGHNSCY